MKRFTSSIIILLFSLTSLLCFEASFAETTQNQETESNQYSSKQENEYVSTLKAAIQSATQGPATIPLTNQAILKISANYLFVPKNEAAAFMRANGNTTGSEFVGLILSKDDDLRWFITVNFIESGYLRDNDAKNWTADGLMKNIKEGNDEENKERISNGFPSLDIMGWIESPKYNSSTHKLVWSMWAQDANSGSEPIVNYRTYVLGREGYFKLNLVTSKSAIEQDKFIVQKILSSLYFTDGKRYEDFNEHTDRIAEYGLAALITGVAAKKLGLLALAGAFLIKLWKLVFVLPVLLWGWIKKLLGMNNANTDASK